MINLDFNKVTDYTEEEDFRNKVQTNLNKRVVVNGYFSCYPMGCYLLNSHKDKNYYIEIFSPGLQKNLPKPPFRPMGGSLYSILEKVRICGVLNKSTSFRGISSLSDIEYIIVIDDDGNEHRYDIHQRNDG